MTDSNILLLYVADPAASCRFYSAILGREPVEESPTFALYVLDSGLAVGLWRRDGVAPAPEAAPGACDLGFKVSRDGIDALCDDWRRAGARIVMEPIDLDFGRSFVAVDPDGHRLRVYALADAA